MRRHAALLALALLLALFSSAGGNAQNIVLFVTDDQGQDAAGCYGNAAIHTPHLDRLAAQGTRFRYAFCTTASCSPSRSVILSGLHNHANGQYGLAHYNFTARKNLKTLSARLAEKGYRTARVGKFHVAPAETFPFEKVLRASSRHPVEMANRCRELIEAESEQPFFILFATSDPHRGGKVPDTDIDAFGNRPEARPGIAKTIYDPKDVIVPGYLPDTPASRAELAQYYESVSRVDQGLGRLLEILAGAGKLETTLILYISDHGAAFPGAKTTVYEPGLLSPCVVRAPGVKRRGVVSNAMVSWVDITPTLLDYAGALDEAAAFHGRSFLGTIERESPEGWDEIYASHTFHEVTMYYPMRVVRTRRFKLIWNIAHTLPFPFAKDLWNSATWQRTIEAGPDLGPERQPLQRYGPRLITAFLERPRFELYDLTEDPLETKNLAGDAEHAETLRNLQERLRKFQQRTKDPWRLKWTRE